MAVPFSLKDLLIAVKKGGADGIPSENEVKQAKRSWSAVSSTNSAQSRCHV